MAEMLSSVSYESYRQCMEEYDRQKEDDRIRKGGNRDVVALLNEIERMNKEVAVWE